MKYAIELLKKRLGLLDGSYHEFVVIGSLQVNCHEAVENRDKAADCENAIKILEAEPSEKPALNIADVSNSTCLTCQRCVPDTQVENKYKCIAREFEVTIARPQAYVCDSYVKCR